MENVTDEVKMGTQYFYTRDDGVPTYFKESVLRVTMEKDDKFFLSTLLCFNRRRTIGQYNRCLTRRRRNVTFQRDRNNAKRIRCIYRQRMASK